MKEISNIDIVKIYSLYIGSLCKHKDLTSIKSYRTLIGIGGYDNIGHISLRLGNSYGHHVSDFLYSNNIKWSIIVKSLNKISNDDLLHIAKLVCYRRQKANIEPINYEIVDKCVNILNNRGALLAKIEVTLDGVSYTNNSGMEYDYYVPNQYAITDYLRSKSYALPYNEYTVDELIEQKIYHIL